MRYVAYKNGECPGSWQHSRNQIVGNRRHFGEWSHTARVICHQCGRKVSVSRRGIMHRHERRVKPMGALEELQNAVAKLIVHDEYYCDTGSHYGLHRVVLIGYVTPAELALLRGEKKPQQKEAQ